MKFFIPGAKDHQQAEEVYASIKKFATTTLGWPVVDRRIFRIKYEHKGRIFHAQVGQPDPNVGEVVIAILESQAYLVCTANRGALRGVPILVGKNEVIEIEDFDEQ